MGNRSGSGKGFVVWTVYFGERYWGLWGLLDLLEYCSDFFFAGDYAFFFILCFDSRVFIGGEVRWTMYACGVYITFVSFGVDG